MAAVPLEPKLILPGYGVRDGREAVAPVMAFAGETTDAPIIPARHQPVAVMFDFVNP